MQEMFRLRWTALWGKDVQSDTRKSGFYCSGIKNLPILFLASKLTDFLLLETRKLIHSKLIQVFASPSLKHGSALPLLFFDSFSFGSGSLCATVCSRVCARAKLCWTASANYWEPSVFLSWFVFQQKTILICYRHLEIKVSVQKPDRWKQSVNVCVDWLAAMFGVWSRFSCWLRSSVTTATVAG